MNYLFDSWELISLVVDGTVVFIVYYLYHKTSKELDMLLKAPTYDLNSDLIHAINNSTSKSLPYACLRGTVKSVDTPINSRYTNAKGVIQDISLLEHRAKRINTTWFNEIKVIKNNTYNVPFVLTNSKSKIEVNIKDPLSSDYLLQNLQKVHDSYEPVKTQGFDKVVDVISGEVIRGRSITEKMLVVGADLTAFGTIKYNQDNCLVLKPLDGHRYILSTMSRREIIEDAKSAVSTYKICTYIVLGIGGIICLIWMRRKYVERKESIERKRVASEIMQRDSTAVAASQLDDISTCVVCLTAPRNVLLLPCRHIVTCEKCTDALSRPIFCPVCREMVDSNLPVYLS